MKVEIEKLKAEYEKETAIVNAEKELEAISENAEKAAKEAEEAAALERLNNPTTEELLKDIRELLRNR